MMYLKLAWRNMWRSRRRTAITVSSILFAVIFAILMRVITVGMFEKMIADTVKISTGYLQIHKKGYWANKTVDSVFNEDPALAALLDHDPGIVSWTRKVESFSLASSGERTRGIIISGIEPERETRFSGLVSQCTTGKYLSDSDHAVMLAEGLARYLGLKVNDTVVLLGQGYQGQMATGKFPVKGIIKLGMPEMNKSFVWMPLTLAREYLSTGESNTAISIIPAQVGNMEVLRNRILTHTPSGVYEVMTWQDMLPELDQFYRGKLVQNEIMSGILYLVIAFGIFGTILMMLNERMHEFGILIAIGMKKWILALTVLLEMTLMSLFGGVLGMFAAWPIVWYFRKNPIHFSGDTARVMEKFNVDPVIIPSMGWQHFVLQGYVVAVMSIILSLFAVIRIFRITAIKAINS